MKVTKQETLYHEDYGATLKHKCGKRIVTLPLFFSFFLFLGRLLGPLFLFRLFGLSFFHGAMLYNDDHHTFIYLQPNITTRY